MILPKIYGVTQLFDNTRINDVPRAVRAAFADMPGLRDRVKPGMTAALCVGSRGIANLPELVKTTIECLRDMGLDVFITPCMGSHGGGTEKGQTELLDGLGVSEKSMGVPVRAKMDVETLGRLENGPGVYFSKEALAADLIVPIVRVKQHTRLVGEIGSGFCKMLCIGCGKISGAEEYHRFGVEKPLLPAALTVLEKVDKLFCGLAVVENAHDHLHTMRLVLPRDFVETDKEFLRLARSFLPTIPLSKADVLIVEKMGKDISGAGADVNVIGKWRRDGGIRAPDFDIQAVLDITDVSHGNAMGMGNFDLSTEYFRDKIDFNATYINALTSTRFRAARLPMIVKNDKVLLENILQSRAEPGRLSMVVITSTAELARLWVTENLLEALKDNPKISIDSEAQEFRFDGNGRMIPFA